MLALADEVRPHSVDRCWPGQNKLAQKARCTSRQIRRLLKELEEMGELKVTRRRGLTRDPVNGRTVLTCLYVLTPGGQPIPPPQKVDVSTSNDLAKEPTATTGHSGSPTGHSDAGNGHIEESGPDSAVSDKPEKDLEEKPVRIRKNPVGLSGHPDYEKAILPRIKDYGGDMGTLIECCPDPILAAGALVKKWTKSEWGFWTKVLHRAAKVHGKDRAYRVFRGILHELHSEMKQGADEWKYPERGLNMKLRRNFPECMDGAK